MEEERRRIEENFRNGMEVEDADQMEQLMRLIISTNVLSPRQLKQCAKQLSHRFLLTNYSMEEEAVNKTIELLYKTLELTCDKTND